MMNNQIEDTAVENEDMPASPVGLKLGRTQMWGSGTAEDAIAINPQDSDAWYTKGVALQLEAEDYQGAVESYSRALEINPQYFSALFNRGFAYKDMGRIDEAKADFETIVTLKNGVAPQALYNLALIAMDQGDTVLGDEYLQKAYEQDPSLRP